MAIRTDSKTTRLRRLGAAAGGLILMSWLLPTAGQPRPGAPSSMMDVGATGGSIEDPSGRITDTLTVYNRSAVGWYAPEVKTVLPTGVHFVVADRKTDACAAVVRAVTCRVGTLRVMQSRTITIVLQATDPRTPVRRIYTIYPLDTDGHPDDNTITLTSSAPAVANAEALVADPLIR